MPIIDELLVGLGFEYDPKDLKNFKNDVGKTTDIIKKMAKAAIAGAAAITGIAVASTRASDEQGKLASEIGETVENIDALQFALKIAGGSAEGMTNSLRQLSIRAAEAARGVGSGVEAFGLLGISSTDAQGRLKPISDLMLEVSTQFQNLGKAQQIELADKLGIRDSILLLQQGPRAIRELVTEAQALGVTTAEDAAIAAEFQDSLVKLFRIVKQLARTLTRTLAPVLEDMVTFFTDWWKANRDLINQKLPEWIDKFTSAMKLLTIAVGAFLAFRLVGHIAALVTLLRGATLGAIAFNAAMFLLPVIIAALAIAFAALVEDAKVFFEGGESFIGDMLKKYPQWADEIRVVASVLGTVWELTSLIFDGWSKIFDLFKTDITFDDFKDVLRNIPGFLGDISGVTAGAGIVADAATGAINTATTTIVDKIDIIVQGGADTADNIANAVLNVFQQTSQDLNSAVEQ